MFASSTPHPAFSPDLAGKVRPVSLAATRQLPLGTPWRGVFGEGALRRGSTVVVRATPGYGGTSLAWGLCSAATARGHWTAVVGVDDPGVIAMSELGVDLERVFFLPRPREGWIEAVAEFLEGVDLVVVRPPARVSHAVARRLMARARERGAVVVVLSDPSRPWPLPGERSVEIVRSNWTSNSRLCHRDVTLRVGGRGAHDRVAEHVVRVPESQAR